MVSIEGLVYLLNQAGIALAQANANIEALQQENARLVAAQENKSGGNENP